MSFGRELVLVVLVGLGLALSSARTGCAPAGPVETEDALTTDDGSPVLVGRVSRVPDGDSIEVDLDSGPIRVRLHGIDTPEMSQTWGREARVELLKRIVRREVALQPVTHDQYDRMVAVVYLGEESINRWLVQQGHAWAYRQYLEDATFCDIESDARAARRGLWSQPDRDWIAPWEWRRSQRGSDSPYRDYRQETAADCRAAMRPPTRRRRDVDPEAPR